MVVKKIKRRLHRFSLKFVWPLLPAFSIVALAIYLNRSHFFTVKKIVCQIDNLPCPPSFEPSLLLFRNNNIFTLSSQKVKAQLSPQNLNIVDIRVIKKLPQTLKIEIKRRSPLAQLIPVKDLQFNATLSAQLSSKFFSLDESGTVYAALDQPAPGLPTILLPETKSIELGRSDISQVLADLVVLLQQHFVAFETIAWLNPRMIVVQTIPQTYAVFDSTLSLSSQVASLQYILTGSKIEQQLPAKIDLRFDKPVLTY